MSVSHTPGPWELADIGDYIDFDGNSRVVLGDDIRIGVVQVTPGSALFKECEANARLIAAAPDLLEALILLEKRCGPNARDGQQARAAIARATGAA